MTEPSPHVEDDEDAPAARPEDYGEPPDAPSAAHGDFHARSDRP